MRKGILNIANGGMNVFLATVSRGIINLELLGTEGRNDGGLGLIEVRVTKGLTITGDTEGLRVHPITWRKVNIKALGLVLVRRRVILLAKEITAIATAKEGHELKGLRFRANLVRKPERATITPKLREHVKRGHIVLISGLTMSTIELRTKESHFLIEVGDTALDDKKLVTSLGKLVSSHGKLRYKGLVVRARKRGTTRTKGKTLNKDRRGDGIIALGTCE